MSPAETIRARLEQLAAIEKTYTDYAHQRLSERDWHGLWDVAVNLSEVSCERDGLQLALGALMAEPEVPWAATRGRCEMPMEGGCLCALPVGHLHGHSCKARHNTATCESASRDGYRCQKPPGHEGQHRHDVEGAVFATAITWST